MDEISDQLSGAHMVFITAGMGGGTGTGAAPVIARAAREMGILTVGVVTKPFQFEGVRARTRSPRPASTSCSNHVDTLIVIPNQNLFRVANEKTTFADAFAMADQVLYSGVACITDLMVKEGLINLDFADVRAVMRGMGKAMMGTGEASGEKRANQAAEAAIANPLLDDVSMQGARGLLISITGGRDLTLYEVDEAATRIREEVDQDANIILGATFDESLEGIIRVSVVATGIDHALVHKAVELSSTEQRIAEVAERLRAEARARVAIPAPVPVFGAPSERASSPLAETPAEAPQPVPVRPAPKADELAPIVLPETPLPPRQAAAFAPPPPAAPLPVVEEPPMPAVPFIPPQAERPMRPTRMPRVEDLPVPAQNQLRATRGEADAAAHHDQRRMSLLQRIATVGLGRKDGPAGPPAPAERPSAPSGRPAGEGPQRPTVSPAHAEYSKRAGAAGLPPGPRRARSAWPRPGAAQGAGRRTT